MGAEAQLEKKAVAHCKKVGVYTRKFTSPSSNSVPDRLFIANGNTLFLEFKARGAQPTDAQWEEINLIMGAKGLASWVDNFSDVLGFLDKLQRFDYSVVRQCCELHNSGEDKEIEP